MLPPASILDHPDPFPEFGSSGNFLLFLEAKPVPVRQLTPQSRLAPASQAWILPLRIWPTGIIAD
jgi:hypothetical protein